jgi:DNA-binding MarR family transcriptional regulator
MSSDRTDLHERLVQRVMSAGRDNGTRAVMFHQAVAHVLGLNATDTRCLDLIVLHGPASPTELAALTGLTTGAITVLIDRLERAGLVRRRPLSRDRRRTLLVTTPKAMRVLGPLYAPMARRMHGFLSSYSSRDLKFLGDVFARMTEFWKTETAHVLVNRRAAPTKRRRRAAARRRKNAIV